MPSLFIYLGTHFHRQDKNTAINLLHQYINLYFDGDLFYPPDYPNLLWQDSKHFLNYFLVVSGSISLHDFISNKLVDHTFFITLNLSLQCHQFGPKFSKLGFSPIGSMMTIENGPSFEFWLNFCPMKNSKDLTIANATPFLNEKHSDSRLLSLYFNIVIMFLIHTLSMIPSLLINVMHPYSTNNNLKSSLHVAYANRVYIMLQ